MARARNIKPGFFKNEDLSECSAWARLCFAGLWTLADREGRLEDRPKRIKGELFAFDTVEVEPLLAELSQFGFILRYQAKEKRFIQIIAFHKHQNPHHKEPPSTIPAPESLGFMPHASNTEPEALHPCNGDETLDKPETSPSLFGYECSKHGGKTVLNPDPGFLIPDSLYPIAPAGVGVDPEKQKPEYPPGFVKFWDTWPSNDRKQAKGKCFESWKRAGAERDSSLILAHVLSLKNSAWLKDGGQFVPAPLVYLNQRRWEGAQEASKSSAGSAWEGAR